MRAFYILLLVYIACFILLVLYCLFYTVCFTCLYCLFYIVCSESAVLFCVLYIDRILSDPACPADPAGAGSCLSSKEPVSIPHMGTTLSESDYLWKNTCFIRGCAPVTGSISMTITSFIYSFHLATMGLSA